MAENINAIDWNSLKSGTTLIDRFFPDVTLLKLDDNKANYTIKGNSEIVEIKEYSVKGGNSYKFFQTSKNSIFPLTDKYWDING